ncbi:hypothetical protein HOY34_14750 [Xinfangfangia sp. D13-10-4-6]|uniref:hypothetical protein n=1 Tax=Pseudogemmobacter hezensis TaxID=2737662 RepID=UPI0015549A04|nr:hypothetical protein [Pseudogemmobacter hezensis]NPD16455.1 hypothetical protein [Pseudogemmobacter hezensis]
MEQAPDSKNAAKAARSVGKSRDDRLKAALKANMARRKLQAKGRAAEEREAPGAEQGTSGRAADDTDAGPF